MFKKALMIFFVSSQVAWFSTILSSDGLGTIDAIRQEIATHNNPIATKDTHPALWVLVEKISQAAEVSIPKYITLHEAQPVLVVNNNNVSLEEPNVTAWSNVLGDLYICKEILMTLSQEEVEGIIALAISERKMNRPVKIGGTFFLTWAGVLAAMYASKEYVSWERFFFGDHNSGQGARLDNFNELMGWTTLPAGLISYLVSVNLQKQVDLKATDIVGVENVIKGIEGLDKLEKTYIQENFLTRVLTMLQLKDMCQYVSYPIRSFTPEERVSYLKSLQKN